MSAVEVPGPSPYAKPGVDPETRLTPAEENRFQVWLQRNRIPFNDSATSDYDMRGFWKAREEGDPRAKERINKSTNTMHFPDTWKTPYHPTFSNESIYATSDAPSWRGNKLVAKDGTVLYVESKKSR